MGGSSRTVGQRRGRRSRWPGLDQVGVATDDGAVELVDAVPAGGDGGGAGARRQVPHGEVPERVAGADHHETGAVAERQAGAAPAPGWRRGGGGDAADRPVGHRQPAEAGPSRGRARPSRRAARRRRPPGPVGAGRAGTPRTAASARPWAAWTATAVVTAHSQPAASRAAAAHPWTRSSSNLGPGMAPAPVGVAPTRRPPPRGRAAGTPPARPADRWRRRPPRHSGRWRRARSCRILAFASV